MPTTDLSLTVNGHVHVLSPGVTVPDVLRHIGLDPEQTGIAVAVNDTVVRRRAWPDSELNDGDTVEVITATQGG
ncbi:MAG: sulfur carrier protein ThiS [Bacteroidota bacterium]